jgi:hypothetical protein
MATKEVLVSAIKEWIQNDNEIKTLQREIKSRKDKKKIISDKLVNIMKTNEIDCFDINDGKLIYTQNKVKTSLSKKHITTCLEKYFKNSDNKEIVDDLSNYILDNREVKVTETIRRKQHKNNNE